MIKRPYQMPFKNITLLAAEEQPEQYTILALDPATGYGTKNCVSKEIIGVSQTPGKPTEELSVMVSGISFVRCGEELKPGDLVTGDATGKAIKVTAGASSLGVCMVGAKADEIACVLLNR